MAKNKMILTLGDQEVTLKFNMGTLRRMKDLAGNDPFRPVNTEDMLGMILFSQEVINAGVMTELGTEKPFFTQEQLDDYLTISLMTEIVIAFTQAYSPDVPEVKDDTQPSPVNVQ
ncbi:hypothetical protein [Flavitalea sp.]|nr:hypothetical protein [Flavitalea sp.]